ncbi:MAG TPA: PIG-L deacetylase family protein [Ilumatobacter sp.]
MKRTLLGVWAHPDDEAYLTAGLMAEFRGRGDRVVVITATLGERGTSDPVAWPPERLAVLREHELRTSLAAVGVDELHLLGYMDGECTWNDGTDPIAELMAEIAPDLIVTFGPDGMTGHPDHRAVSAWTTDAWRVARPQADLWYATLGTDHYAQWGALSDHVGLWAEQPSPPCTADHDLAARVTLDNESLDRKLAALQAHASQTTGLIEAVGLGTYREWWRTEYFVAAEIITQRQAA